MVLNTLFLILIIINVEFYRNYYLITTRCLDFILVCLKFQKAKNQLLGRSFITNVRLLTVSPSKPQMAPSQKMIQILILISTKVIGFRWELTWAKHSISMFFNMRKLKLKQINSSLLIRSHHNRNNNKNNNQQTVKT